MATSTYFNNIREYIIEALNKAEFNIIICVAWITDENILQRLVELSKMKIHIEIITQNDEFNRSKASYFNKLIANDSKVYLLDKNLTGGILHHKFCVIDEAILITGSYNWTNNATNNIENIIIQTIEDEGHEVIDGFCSEFNQILYRFGIKDENEEWGKVIDYLEENGKITDAKYNEAKEFYEKALKCWRLDKFETALELINDAILLAPYFVGDFYILRHIILRDLEKYVLSFDDLINFLDGLTIGQQTKIEDFRKIYDIFINTIIVGAYTYKFIYELNKKTEVNIKSFEHWGIIPHIFTFEENKGLPF